MVLLREVIHHENSNEQYKSLRAFQPNIMTLSSVPFVFNNLLFTWLDMFGGVQNGALLKMVQKIWTREQGICNLSTWSIRPTSPCMESKDWTV